MALSLLIDTSSSMEDRMATAQDAAIGFVRKLRPTDLGEVIGFDSRAEVLQKFTSNTAELEQAIRKTVAGGSTSMNNAIYISLKGLKKIPVQQEEEIRRQAIVLLSDGEDTSSLVTFEDVLDLARRSETAIYAIGLMDENAGGQSKGFREATYALRQLTTDTGGRAFFPADIKSLANVYGQIYDELSSQYTIGYTSKNPRRDGAWRRLVVRVARPNVAGPHQAGIFRADRADRSLAENGVGCVFAELAKTHLTPFFAHNHVHERDSAAALYRCGRGVCRAVRQAHVCRQPHRHGAARARRLRSYVRHRHGDHARRPRAVRERDVRDRRRSCGCSRCRISTSS